MSVKRSGQRWNDKKLIFDWHPEDDTSKEYYLSTSSSSLVLPNKRMAGDTSLLDKKERSNSEKIDTRHWSKKPLSEMQERDWRILKEDFSISTKGGRLPNPVRSWKESSLPQTLLTVLERHGYTEPTPIQRQAIPIVMANRDLIGLAETGSGKTLAFLLPIITFLLGLPRISEENASEGPYALILAPTRELALQIEAEIVRFATNPLGFKCVAIVGGHSMTDQAFRLRDGSEIIVATPGRLRDTLDQRILVLNQCSYVVLDEADRMMDLGFEPDLASILDALPTMTSKPDTEEAEDSLLMKKNLFRQTTMFSATMIPSVERLAKKYLRRPAMAIIGTIGLAVESVELRVEMITDERKRSRLIEILESGFASRTKESEYINGRKESGSHTHKVKEDDSPVLIFVNHKKTADSLCKMLDARGYRSTALHGGKSQEARENALALVKSRSREILVATDVASRGLDIKHLALVINYDMAKSIEDFIHRIGRTGRAGSKGISITFLTAEDTDLYYDLKQLILKSPMSRCPPELSRHEAAAARPGTIRPKRKSEETIYASTNKF